MPLFHFVSQNCSKKNIHSKTIFRPNENVYDGIPYKPFNKVIMVLLGTIGDDALNGRNSSLKGLATAWFIDCAKHGDLPRIFQVC